MEYRLKKEREYMDLMLLQLNKQSVNNTDQDRLLEVDENNINIVEEFFKKIWLRKIAYNSRRREQVVETTVEIARTMGVSYTIAKVVYGLKDECEPYRRMVMKTVDKIILKFGAYDIDSNIGAVLMDGIIYAFREQTTANNADDVILNGFSWVLNPLHRSIVRPMMECFREQTTADYDDDVILNGFCLVLNALPRPIVRPYLEQIYLMMRFFMVKKNPKTAKLRQQAVDLFNRVRWVERFRDELLREFPHLKYSYL